MAPIRPHNKTRTGCLTCRKRKIKCDESTPQCGNCSSRQIECLWNSNSNPRPGPLKKAASASVSPAPTAVPRPAPSSYTVTTLDMELMHHYSVNTCTTLCEDRDAQNVWRTVVPHIAFQPGNQYVLHGVLAVAAIQKHTSMPSYPLPDLYSITASKHHKLCLESFPPGPIEDGVPAFLTHLLVGIYGFATSSTVVYAPTNWLARIRDIPVELLAKWPQFQDGPTAPLARINTPQTLHPPYSNFPQALLTIHMAGPDIEEIQDVVVSAAYENAVILLKRSWDASFTVDHHLIAASTMLTITSDQFMMLLREGQPRALVIYAYFCMMMRRMEGTWWTRKNWGKEIERIQGILSPQWQSWIQDPSDYRMYPS